MLWLISGVRESEHDDQHDLWLLDLGVTAERLHFETYQHALDASGGLTKARNAAARIRGRNQKLITLEAKYRKRGYAGTRKWQKVAEEFTEEEDLPGNQILDVDEEQAREKLNKLAQSLRVTHHNITKRKAAKKR